MTVDRDALLGAVRAVNEVVQAKASIPILANLMIEAAEGSAIIRGTDLDIQVDMTVANVAGALATTVSADRLLAAIDTLRGGRIDLTSGEGRLTIKQGRSTRTLPTLPVTDFPVMPADDFEVEFEIGTAALLRLIEATHVAMSNEAARPCLNGIHLHASDDELIAASTDGQRLVRASEKLPLGAGGIPPDVIVPSKTVMLLRKMLANGEDGASALIRVNARKISVRTGQTHLLCKLIEGTYPDYARVIPSGHERLLKVLGSEFTRGVHAAAQLANAANGKGRGRGVKLSLSSDAIEAVGVSMDGSAFEPIDGEYAHDPLELGINSALAIPVAAIFGEAARIEIAFGDAQAPILFTSPDKPALTAVVMPMRV
jgi:DNA polymerase-3 subunit beta